MGSFSWALAVNFPSAIPRMRRRRMSRRDESITPIFRIITSKVGNALDNLDVWAGGMISGCNNLLQDFGNVVDCGYISHYLTYWICLKMATPKSTGLSLFSPFAIPITGENSMFSDTPTYNIYNIHIIYISYT